MSRHHLHMKLAESYAAFSPDPSTKVGAIVADGNIIVSMGFNHIPPQIKYTEAQINNREWKYPRVIHAELEALSRVGVHDLKHPIMYVTHFPCAQCAISIVHAGIKEIYTKRVPLDMIERWGESMKIANQIFIEGNVFVNYLDSP